MSTLPGISETSTRGFQMRATPVGDKGPQPQSHDQGGQQQKAAQPRAAGDSITVMTTNYSIAPGMAWMEFTNAAAVTAGPVTGTVPLWGSGQLLSALKLPLGCVIVSPTVVPLAAAAAQAQQSDAQHQQQQKEQQQKQQQEKEKQQKEQQQKEQQQKQQKQAKDAQEISEYAVTSAQLSAAQLAGMAVETQARHSVDDTLRVTYQQEISTEIQTLWAAQPAALTPDQQRLTGMSPQGFPGFLPGLRSSALPAGMGVNGVYIDNTQVPAQITVTLVGAGSVPANSRWLVFTITGV